MRRSSLIFLPFLLLACEVVDEPGGVRTAPGGDAGSDTGRPATDEEAGEVTDFPAPDRDQPWTEDPVEVPEPDPTGEVCYPGADSDWSTCLPVVDWDPSWGDAYAWPEPLDGDAAYSKPVRFLDLAATDGDLAVAPNFVVSEFMQEWKGRFALYQPHLVETLQAMRLDSGGAIYVNSGFRSPGYNESVDGATWSRHMYGDAVDMYSATLSLSELGDLCEAYGADYVGLYSSHVHCDWRYSELTPAFYDR